jgi:predicted nucleic acid-binding protein
MPIVLDANVFLRALTEPTDPSLVWMQGAARRLFLDAAAGNVELTTTDAVIAEVAFVLTAKTHYRLDPRDACERLLPLLQISNLRFATKRQTLHALDIWTEHPKLGFVDSLVAACAEMPNNMLATFDQDYDRISELTSSRYAWPGEGSNGTI